jgi:hypothetical protein
MRLEQLQKYMIEQRPNGSVLSRKSEFSPLVWCRLAVQFWMIYGGRQNAFLSSMTKWIKDKNKKSSAFVFYETNIGEPLVTVKLPLSVFLLDDFDIHNVSAGGYRLKNIKQLPDRSSSVKPKSSPKRSRQSSIGTNAITFVKDLIQKAAKDPTITNLKKKPDPTTQLYRYTGRRIDLYGELCDFDQELRTKYKQSVVIKAISLLAKCRKYWPAD